MSRAALHTRSASRMAAIALTLSAGCLLHTPYPAHAEPQDVGRDDPPGEVLDMRPDKAAPWDMRYLLAPLISVFRGTAYMYEPRELYIETTPADGYVDLFYVRSGFQKRFEQAEAPLTVILPSRLKAGARDSLTVRGFAEGYRQESRTFKVRSGVSRVVLDLAPLPNTLDGLAHRYFAGRSTVSFLTEEALTFRLQEADDGFAVILTETALSAEARAALDGLRSPLIAEGFAQQLGEDLMVKVILSDRAAAGRSELRSRQRYDAPRALYEFSIDLLPVGGVGEAIETALAALSRLKPDDVSGCALRFDDRMRDALDPGAMSRALSPQGSFTDRYLRAAMRRMGEVSVDGVVDFVDGSRFRPGQALELEMSLSKAGSAKGFIAFLRRFIEELEDGDLAQRSALRSLLAPEMDRVRFDSVLDAAIADERKCSQSGRGSLPG